MTKRISRVIGLLLAVALLAGCGRGNGKKAAPRDTEVSGTVNLNVSELQCDSDCAIYSTSSNGIYAYSKGTSFAAPYVSALAALLVAKGYDAASVEHRLKSTARPLGAGADTFHYGAGLIDAAAAMGLSATGVSVQAALEAYRQQPGSLRAAGRFSAPSPLLTEARAKAVLLVEVEPARKAELRSHLTQRGYSWREYNRAWVIDGVERAEDLARDLAARGWVRKSKRDRLLQPFGSAPAGSLVHKQWGLAYTGFREAWATVPDVDQVVVAVLDTGVDVHHPDLQSVQFVAACDLVGAAGSKASALPNNYTPFQLPSEAFSGKDPDRFCWSDQVADLSGHGTMVTGLIAATLGNQGIDGAGMDAGGRPVSIMPVRVLGQHGGTETVVAYGIYYAVMNGADVINLSLGYEDPHAELTADLKDALDYARSQGVIVVAAAGNGGWERVAVPAIYDPVIAVGAVSAWGVLAEYSNHGVGLDLVAPGGGALAATVFASKITSGSGSIDVIASDITAPALYGGAFRLTGLPAGVSLYIHAWIDMDLNGRIGPGDYYGRTQLLPSQAGESIALPAPIQLSPYTGAEQVLR